VACLGTVFAGPAAMADETPKGFDCTFAAGESWSHDGKDFASGTAVPIAFSVRELDVARQTALITGAGGDAKARLAQAIGGWHLIEVAVEGYLNLTTIYETPDADGRLPAAHSRHLAVLGKPLVAQYRGSCGPLK
jgi:hypothetical protein